MTTTRAKLEAIVERRLDHIIHLLRELDSELHAVRMELFKIEGEVAALEGHKEGKTR